MNEKLIEIRSYDGSGYQPLVDYGGWRVAVLNFADAPEEINQVERHNQTDEVFVLTKGQGVLVVGEGSERPQRLVSQVMELGKLYNVKKAVWHAVLMSLDASILIVENQDTTEDNSDYCELTSAEKALFLNFAQKALTS